MEMKGFVFTTDAVFAIILILLASNIYLVTNTQTTPTDLKIEILQRETQDKMIVASYTGKNPVEMGLKENLEDLVGKNNVICETFYTYKNGEFTKQKFCEGV